MNAKLLIEKQRAYCNLAFALRMHKKYGYTNDKALKKHITGQVKFYMYLVESLELREF